MAEWARVCGAIATLALVVPAAGCGDDPDLSEERRPLVDTSQTGGTSSATASSTAAGPSADGPAADAYLAWLDALDRHDAAAACALQAPEYTIQLRYDAILVDRAELGDPCVVFEALVWEDPAFDSEVVDIEVTQETEEDALLDVDRPSGDLTVRMVYHRAHWRVFATTDRAGPSSPASARWLGAWCALSPDLTRDEIVDLMGPPSGEYTVSDGGEPQLWWARDQYDFRVYLDVDGSVLELVGDYDALSEEDRAHLPCPELRS